MVGSAALGCGEREQTPPDPIQHGLEELRRIEAEARAEVDFARRPPASRILGADPYRVAAWGGGWVGITRGTSRLVVRSGARADVVLATPEGPTGLSVAGEDVWVSGRREPSVARYVRGTAGNLAEDARWVVPGAVALRDVVATEDAVYVVDDVLDALFWAPLDEVGEELAWARQPTCEGPIGLERTGDTIVLRCLVDHRVVLRPLGPNGVPDPARDTRITHDGPIWSSAVTATSDGTRWLALGGVEDRPLDRSGGFFGHIDSFLFLYRVSPEGGLERHAELNLSEVGVITPKAMAWTDESTLVVTGFGGERAVRVRRGDELEVIESVTWPPGANDVIGTPDGAVVAANPLLDAWSTGWTLPSLDPVDGPRPSAHAADVRLGEVMIFTSLMAPYNSSRGAHSRFSCETCHFEGHGDGRTHHTGRGEVHATTKPLYGLFNNKPHFTRALDRDLTRVAHAEFRVAGAESGHHPWFQLETAERPWLAAIVGHQRPLSPVALRTGVLRFLMAFAHRPNPRLRGREGFTPQEKSGAALFEQRCVSCHAARLSTDDPSSDVPRAEWEAMIFDRGAPIVWASEAYRRVGVEPHVHPDGARTTSLRRVEHKRPYFTNGSVRSLEALVEQLGWRGEEFFHAGAPADATRLAADEREAILAFLRLL